MEAPVHGALATSTDCLHAGADSLLWRDDSSGSETPEPPHYPLDLRLAEARHQLEERLAQEARDMKRLDDRRGLDERRLTTEALRAYEDRRFEERRLAEDRKMAASDSWSDRGGSRSDRRTDVRKSPGDGREGGGVQFVLGGENLVWPGGEELTRATLHSQSQPQLRASMRVTPMPPPRRPHSNIAVPMVRSRSSDVMMPSVEEPRAPPRHPIFTKQKTLAEETGHISDTQTTESTPPEEESTDSSLMEDDTSSKPRRRKIHFPFIKKAKGLPA